MDTPLHTIKKNGKTATIALRGSQYLYSVWHPSKGFVATGFRKTEAEALKSATIVLKAR